MKLELLSDTVRMKHITMTVWRNAHCILYIEILDNFFFPSIENSFGDDDDEVIFQDNNTSCYKEKVSNAFLQKRCRKLMTLSENVEFSLRDLFTTHFGYLKACAGGCRRTWRLSQIGWVGWSLFASISWISWLFLSNHYLFLVVNPGTSSDVCRMAFFSCSQSVSVDGYSGQPLFSSLGCRPAWKSAFTSADWSLFWLNFFLETLPFFVRI